MTEHIKIERKDGILTLTFARPDKKNAMNPQLIRDMTQVLEDLRYNDDVRVLVLREREVRMRPQRDRAFRWAAAVQLPVEERGEHARGAVATHAGEQLEVLTGVETRLEFEGFAKPPILSINRGFSAPVAIEADVSVEDLVFLAAHDDDPFARYEAMQSLVVQHLVAAVGGGMSQVARNAAPPTASANTRTITIFTILAQLSKTPRPPRILPGLRADARGRRAPPRPRRWRLADSRRASVGRGLRPSWGTPCVRRSRSRRLPGTGR